MKRLVTVGLVVLAMGSLVGGVCLAETKPSPKTPAKAPAAAVAKAPAKVPPPVVAKAPARAPAPVVEKAPAEEEEEASTLAEVREITTGTLAAIYVTQLVTAYKMLETPMLAAYDSENDVVSIMLYGPAATMDQGKAVIEGFRSKALSLCIQTLASVYDIEVEEGDFTLAYFDLSKDKVTVEWADDEYTIH